MATDDPSLDGAPGAASARAGALEIRGSATGLLDEPFDLRVRGCGPDARLVWRARYRDDDGRIWRAAGLRCEDLATDWSPLKDGTGDMAALRSLRAVSIDLRVETADGRAAARTLTRLIAAEGVRTRRWRDGLSATLHVPAQSSPTTALAGDATPTPAQPSPATAPAGDATPTPAQPSPVATVIVDATGAPAHAAVAVLAAPMLASRGVLVLVVAAADARTAGDPLATARERLSAVPGASEAIVLTVADPFDGGRALDPDAVVLPPGVGIREPAPDSAARRAAAWDRLLDRLGAQPRERPTAR